MTEHTLLPWHLEEGDLMGNAIVAADGTRIADAIGWGPEDEARSQYIVRACNAFPELVKLLRDLRGSTAQDIDLIEEWCQEEGKPYIEAARPGIVATRALHDAVDVFLEEMES